MAAKKNIGGLNFDLTASTAKFKRDMEKGKSIARKSAKNMSKSFRSMNSASKMLTLSLGKLGIAAGAVAGPAALGALINKAIDTADNLAKTADAANISTDSLQELQHAAELSGVSSDSLNSALKAFSKRVGEARAGTGTLITLLNKQDKALLENVKSAQNTEQAFDLIINAAADMGNQLDRNALLSAAFGRTAGVEMANMLKNGSAGLEEMRQEARDLGLVIDESLLRNAEEAKDAMTRLSSVVKTNVTSAMLTAAPEIENVSKKLVEVLPKVLDFVDQIIKATGLVEKTKLELDLEHAREQFEHFRDRYNDISKQIISQQNKMSIAINTGIGDPDKIAATITELERQKDAINEQYFVWLDAAAGIEKAIKKEEDALNSLSSTNSSTNNEINESNNETVQNIIDGLDLRMNAWKEYQGTFDTVLSEMLASEEDTNRKRVESYLKSIKKMKEIDAERSASRQADHEDWLKTDLDLAGERIAVYQQYTNAIGDLGDNVVAAQNANVDKQTRVEIANATKSYNAQKALIEQRYTVNGELSKAGIQKMNELEQGHAALVENLETRAMQMKERNARKLKAIRIAQAIANTAAAVIEALKAGPIIGQVLAGIVAATGAAQIATIRAQPYAKGGIVDEPTYFNSNRQLSVMGEAGREAIMPVTRTSNGDLGVRVQLPEDFKAGNNVLNMNLHFSGPISDKKYIESTVVPILQEGARKGYNKLMVKR